MVIELYGRWFVLPTLLHNCNEPHEEIVRRPEFYMERLLEKNTFCATGSRIELHMLYIYALNNVKITKTTKNSSHNSV